MRTRPVRASMIEPIFTCRGEVSGTNALAPGTLISTTGLTGRRLTLTPATGSGKPVIGCGPASGCACGCDGSLVVGCATGAAATATGIVDVAVLEAPSVTASRAV